MIKTFAEWQKQELLTLSIPHKNTDWSPYLDEILDAYEAFVKVVSEYQKVLLIIKTWNFCVFLQMIRGYAIMAR